MTEDATKQFVRRFCGSIKDYKHNDLQTQRISRQLNGATWKVYHDVGAAGGDDGVTRRSGHSSVMTQMAVGTMLAGVDCTYITMNIALMIEAIRLALQWVTRQDMMPSFHTNVKEYTDNETGERALVFLNWHTKTLSRIDFFVDPASFGRDSDAVYIFRPMFRDNRNQRDQSADDGAENHVASSEFSITDMMPALSLEDNEMLD